MLILRFIAKKNHIVCQTCYVNCMNISRLLYKRQASTLKDIFLYLLIVDGMYLPVDIYVLWTVHI